jgi:hypothetical protein
MHVMNLPQWTRGQWERSYGVVVQGSVLISFLFRVGAETPAKPPANSNTSSWHYCGIACFIIVEGKQQHIWSFWHVCTAHMTGLCAETPAKPLTNSNTSSWRHFEIVCFLVDEESCGT